MAQKSALPTTRMTTNPALRRIRVEQVLKRKLSGYSHQEVADELGIAIGSVTNDMHYASKHGLLDKIEQRLLSDLVPLAINVYKKKLIEDEDAFVAKDVLSIVTKLGDRKAKSEQVVQTLTIQDYLQAKHASAVQLSEAPVNSLQIPGELIHEDDPDSREQAE